MNQNDPDKEVKVSQDNIVSEEIKDNHQAGKGQYREVRYEDGGFRQYDTETGELIGSSYKSDQKYLPNIEWGENVNKKVMIALLVLVLATSVVYAAQASHMEVKSPDRLRNGDFFNLTLTAQDGSPIANQTVDIIVIAESGEKNHINFTTDNNGNLGFGIAGVNPGNYTFNCTFNGTADYETCNVVQKLIVEA